MNILGKKIRTAVLALCIALSLMFGSTQQSKAAFYDYYYNLYSYYLSLTVQYHSVPFGHIAFANLYYYYAGYFADYYGYAGDQYGYKSVEYGGNTQAAYYYDYFTYIGDFVAHSTIGDDRDAGATQIEQPGLSRLPRFSVIFGYSTN